MNIYDILANLKKATNEVDEPVEAEEMIEAAEVVEVGEPEESIEMANAIDPDSWTPERLEATRLRRRKYLANGNMVTDSHDGESLESIANAMGFNLWKNMGGKYDKGTTLIFLDELIPRFKQNAAWRQLHEAVMEKKQFRGWKGRDYPLPGADNKAESDDPLAAINAELARRAKADEARSTNAVAESDHNLDSVIRMVAEAFLGKKVTISVVVSNGKLEELHITQ